MTLAVTMFAINKAGSEYWSFSDKLDSKESIVGLASSAAVFFISSCVVDTFIATELLTFFNYLFCNKLRRFIVFLLFH